MTTAPDAKPAERRWTPAVRLTPEAVRRFELGRTALGRRGFVESDVERFRARVADELGRCDAERAELREEIERLRNYFRRNGFDPSGGAGGRPAATNGTHPGEGLSVQAVNLLSQAQQAADQHIAAAEDYARKLVGDARRQYEEILVQAHDLAESAAAQAAERYREATALGDRVVGHEELTAKLAYLRTFAEVTQVQMRSILDALRQELDRLAVLNSDPSGPGHTAGPGWDIPSGVAMGTVVTTGQQPPEGQSRPAAFSAR